MGDMSNEEVIEFAIKELLEMMKEEKPNDRSAQDRNWAVAITEVEKVKAYWNYYIVKGNS